MWDDFTSAAWLRSHGCLAPSAVPPAISRPSVVVLPVGHVSLNSASPGSHFPAATPCRHSLENKAGVHYNMQIMWYRNTERLKAGLFVFVAHHPQRHVATFRPTTQNNTPTSFSRSWIAQPSLSSFSACPKTARLRSASTFVWRVHSSKRRRHSDACCSSRCRF